jgi:putative transposase
MRRVPVNRAAPGRGFFVTARMKKKIADEDLGRFAQLVIDTLLFYRRRGDIILSAFVIMPDHVHFVIRLREHQTFSRWINSFKSYVATHYWAGPIWQVGCWTESLSSEALASQKVSYTHLNPVRAGYVERPEEWAWSSAVDYCSPETSDRIDFV